MSRWLYFLIRARRPLWVRTALLCLAGLGMAELALVIGPHVPEPIALRFGGEAVGPLLSILSSSMLAVATFSLGTMVSAHNSAASNATPRAAPLLVEDNYAQNALSTFIGIFVFSVVALVGLDAGIYEAGAKAVLFFITLVVLFVVVVMLIPWVNELSYIGQLRDTLDLIEAATGKAIRSQLDSPFNHGIPFNAVPDGHDLYAEQVGYIQTVDFEAIDELVAGTTAHIYLCCQPGSLTHRHRQLCRITGVDEADAAALIKSLRKSFRIGPKRTMLQDPRYGMILLAEVASRSLSPGVNDPGTAIDVIVTATRTLDVWHQAQGRPIEESVPRYEWLHAKPLDFTVLLTNAFDPIIRYGSSDFTVMNRLLKALSALASLDRALCAEPARRTAKLALKQSLENLESEDERHRLQACFDAAFAQHARIETIVARRRRFHSRPIRQSGLAKVTGTPMHPPWPIAVPTAVMMPALNGVRSPQAIAARQRTGAWGTTAPRRRQRLPPYCGGPAQPVNRWPVMASAYRPGIRIMPVL